jgi:hypothetical protein
VSLYEHRKWKRGGVCWNIGVGHSFGGLGVGSGGGPVVFNRLFGFIWAGRVTLSLQIFCILEHSLPVNQLWFET